MGAWKLRSWGCVAIFCAAASVSAADAVVKGMDTGDGGNKQMASK